MPRALRDSYIHRARIADLTLLGVRPDAGRSGDMVRRRVRGRDLHVQVFQTADAIAPRGKRQVLLRIRFRRITEDFVELVPRSFTEVFIHRTVRRLIGETWPN